MGESPLLEYIMMGFLSCGEKTGYDIKREMSMSTAYFYEASYGSIYPVLKKLVEKNDAGIRELVENGKFKKVYHLTDQGRSRLINWLLEKPRIDDGEMLVRMHFYPLLAVEQIEPLVNHYIHGVEKLKNELDILDSEWREANPVSKGTLQYGRDFFQYQVDWFRRYLARIKNEGPIGGHQE